MRRKKLKINVSMPRNSWDNGRTAKLEKAVKFFLNKLNVSTRLQNTLNIKVHVRKTVLDKDTLGNCTVALNGCNATKDFTIILDDNQSHHQNLETLAHECVHIEQQITKRFQLRVWSSDKKTHVRWEGKECGIYLQDIPYHQAPWEFEAKNKQSGLANDFARKEAWN